MADRRRRILIVYTGGTIGMRKTAEGYRPAPGFLGECMAATPSFTAPEVPEYEIHEMDPLLDSSNMTPQGWICIARVILERYEQFDGFLVLHGTDTMAFTSSALSFMIEGLRKPVFVTGSQIPFAETRNDAQDNLLSSLIILGAHGNKLPGVYLYFDNTLHRGTRATKTDAEAFAAFNSPNFPAVGKVGIKVEIDWDLVRAPDYRSAKPRLIQMGTATIAAFRIFPGLKAEYLTHILTPPVQGVVLECFGSGNAPNQDEALMQAIRAASTRGVVLVAVTQPLRGAADLKRYETGRGLLAAGVVSGHDMTAEAALAKLFYLFEKGHTSEEVRNRIQENLCGELTSPEEAATVQERMRVR